MALQILGVEFYPITLQGAVGAVDWMLARQDGCTRLVVTANPVMVMSAQKDPQFMSILKTAHLIVPDGVGILWAARKQGRPLPERVTGVDLAYELLHKEPSPRFFFLGGKQGVAKEAANKVMKEFPRVEICGTHHGYFKPHEEEKVVQIVSKAKPDILFCAMGSPRQEKFIWKYRNELGAKVGIGLGGALDIFAGRASRAPQQIQKLGLEWLYRLVREPARIKRNISLLEFAAKIQLESYRRQKTPKEGVAENAGTEKHRQSKSDS